MSVINTLSLSIYPSISFALFALHSTITMSICLQSLSFRIVWVKFLFFILLLMLLLLLLFDANRIETGCTHAHRSSLFYHLRFMLIVSVLLSAFVMPPMHDMLITIFFPRMIADKRSFELSPKENVNMWNSLIYSCRPDNSMRGLWRWTIEQMMQTYNSKWPMYACTPRICLHYLH